jgi:hypothetical protein
MANTRGRLDSRNFGSLMILLNMAIPAALAGSCPPAGGKLFGFASEQKEQQNTAGADGLLLSFSVLSAAQGMREMRLIRWHWSSSSI